MSSRRKIGYKLFRQRKDGTLGPLFINRRQRIELGVAYQAEDHPTKGYAHRPGWHVCSAKRAPHLSEKGRVWAKVAIEGVTEVLRPDCQGGKWYLAARMTVLKVLS